MKEFFKGNLVNMFNNIEDQFGVSQFFIQNCLYPRMKISPDDAIFSIKFLQRLVEYKVPKINILNIFAQIIRRIIPTIHTCTSNEAENLGLFFLEWF